MFACICVFVIHSHMCAIADVCFEVPSWLVHKEKPKLVPASSLVCNGRWQNDEWFLAHPFMTTSSLEKQPAFSLHSLTHSSPATSLLLPHTVCVCVNERWKKREREKEKQGRRRAIERVGRCVRPSLNHISNQSQ